jgi:transmembrane sensor
MRHEPADHRLEEAVRLVQGAWTPMRAAEAERRLRERFARQARRRRTAAVGSVGLLLGAAGLALLVWGRGWLRPPEEVAALPSSTATEHWTFADGSIAEPTVAETDLRVVERTERRHVVRILRGGARFDVVHREKRLFRVEIHDVAIEVLGTAFRAEAVAEGVRVAVERGRVRVRRGDEVLELAKGESRLFPETPAVAEAPAPQAAPPPPRRRARLSPQTSWRTLAQRGDYHGAYRALDSRGQLPDRPEALLQAADVARRTGHPTESLVFLRAVVTRFPRDERAPLAAFTMGLIELEKMGRPNEAARSFARSIRLAPRGALAEDALAREVEAWSAAGDRGRARAQAAEYLQRYPGGRRTTSVRRFAQVQ